MIYELKIVRNLPPSMNDSKSGYGGASHHAGAKTKKAWEGLLFVGLLEAKVPKPLPALDATALLIVPTRHRRDQGNFRMVLEKSLGDVLQKMGYIPDDTPEWYRFGGLEFEYQKGVRETRVTLTTRQPDAGGTG